jgi:hypothetical protein
MARLVGGAGGTATSITLCTTLELCLWHFTAGYCGAASGTASSLGCEG